MNISNKVKIIAGLALTLMTAILIPKLWEDVDAGEVVVIQDAFDGDLHVYTEPGWVYQGGGRATHYRKSNQFWFSKHDDDEDSPNLSIPVKWNDGGHSIISGSVRYDLPLSEKAMVRIHSIFGSQRSLELELIKTNIEKAVYMTGPLMTSKESYAEKRNDLIFYIEDQASQGVYKTRQREVKEIDQLSGQDKMITRVEITEDSLGTPFRQEISPILTYGIRLYNISINGIEYDDNVEQQIATQQQAVMQVQTAIAKAKEAEQRALTVAKEGEANAASAKWEQEVLKAKTVTSAEARKEVAALDVETAELEKRKAILEGQGEAEKKRLTMQADGALKQKLDAWLASQKYWAEAFANYDGNVVPTYSTGASGGANGATEFMSIMGMKAARDLNLDMKVK